MEYRFADIENEIKQFWEKQQVYKVEINHSKPKYYVLDMFPYPSGAGLHVGHPLGYIASDIFSRYKRMKGFNVLHPMGYDSFGLPAEQYAIQTGQHPAVTTEQNLKRYREQLDKIGFSFDWSRQVKTSDPEYYKWTQWIFIQLFKSWYNKKTDKAEYIDTLIAEFEKNGNAKVEAACSDFAHSKVEGKVLPHGEDLGGAFTAADWKAWSEKQQQEMLLNYRLAYLADSWVNWCAALGTVLANDEVKDGVSERGGYPVEQRLMKQWSLRITAYSERLLQGLNEVEWSESIKEAQRNWIGRSEGARVKFQIATPLQGRGAGGEVSGAHDDKNSTPRQGGEVSGKYEDKVPPYFSADSNNAGFLVNQARTNRKNPTEAEELLWEKVRNSQLGVRFRRQHYIGNYIVDFLCLSKMLIIELDGEQHKDKREQDIERTNYLNAKGYTVIRFWNDEVVNKMDEVIKKIEQALSKLPDYKDLTPNPSPLERDSQILSLGEDLGEVIGGAGGGNLFIEVFTTRPDTIFGVTFMVLAPEHELVKEITTPEQKEKVEAYIKKASSKSERERNADVKNVSGEFTGAYVIHPFTGKDIPVYIADYVLATYGTGAVMAVPSGDSRDFRFAKHFNLPIPNVFSPTKPPQGGGLASTNDETVYVDISEGAYEGKEGYIVNSGFLNGLKVPAAMRKAIEEIEKKGIGEGKVNYRQRDAIFGRQRYWGEPIPIYYKDGVAYPVEEKDLPVVLPEIDKYLPTETGEPPLARAANWKYSPTQTLPGKGEGLTSLQNETFGGKSNTIKSEGKVSPNGGDLEGARGEDLGGAAYPLELTTMPGWAGSSWYYLRYMDPHNPNAFAGKEALDYWKNIDFYIGGSEHATGHLLYFRFWTKFLYDLGYISIDEPAKKMVNQGMIQGVSRFIYQVTVLHYLDMNKESNIPIGVDRIVFGNEVKKLEEITNGKVNNAYIFVSADIIQLYKELINNEETKQGLLDLQGGKPNSLQESLLSKTQINSIHVPIEFYDENNGLKIDLFKKWIYNKENTSTCFVVKDGCWIYGNFYSSKNHPDKKFLCIPAIEKMSKSKYNVVNPDDVIADYGADCFRMYEMFLGPIELSKPWDTQGIDGTSRFLRKLWRLFYNEETDRLLVTDDAATSDELKILHKTIKKVNEDIERLAFNTSVSAFMVCVNELSTLKCSKRSILEPLVSILHPFAPFITEYLWKQLGHTDSVLNAPFPMADESLLVENSYEYPVSVNGKVRTKLNLPLELQQAEVEREVLALDVVQKWLEGKAPKKVIYVKGRMINVVV